VASAFDRVALSCAGAETKSKPTLRQGSGVVLNISSTMPIDVRAEGLFYVTTQGQLQNQSREIRMDILVVDDSKTMRMIVLRAIRQAGFRDLMVGEAENGAIALKKLRDEQPRIILSDWNMPEMNGLDFLKQVRAEQNQVPFGFITSEASAGMKDIALSAGAMFLITKPFSPEDVQEALSPFLERK
jgi:two-component system chemotaxis response regulator CheY